jgi:hypothetical protein
VKRQGIQFAAYLFAGAPTGPSGFGAARRFWKHRRKEKLNQKLASYITGEKVNSLTASAFVE